MGKNRRIDTHRKMEGSRILKKWEYLMIVISGLGLTIGISWLFYDSFWGSIGAVIVIPILYCMRLNKRRKERQRKLSTEFKEYIYLVGSALFAGYSIERAFLDALQEFKKTKSKEEMSKSVLYPMLIGMEQRLSIKEPIETILQDFARESRLEDIWNFAEIFCYAKRSGGDFIHIIQTTIDKIGDKMEIMDEIEIVLAQKMLEQKIMSMVPIGILVFFRLTSPEFMEILYGNPLGICVMSIGLVVYGFAFWLGQKLVDIKV